MPISDCIEIKISQISNVWEEKRVVKKETQNLMISISETEIAYFSMSLDEKLCVNLR